MSEHPDPYTFERLTLICCVADVEISPDNLRAKCNICANFNSRPTTNHWIARDQIIRHLGTPLHKKCMDAENLRLANRAHIERISHDENAAEAQDLNQKYSI